MTVAVHTTKVATVEVGWTQSDMANGYSSYDGYRPGARQYVETIEVEVPQGIVVEAVAEAVFEATNCPFPVTALVDQVRRALVASGFDGSQAGHFSLSTGDTVAVTRGGTTERLACESLGWVAV